MADDTYTNTGIDDSGAGADNEATALAEELDSGVEEHGDETSGSTYEGMSKDVVAMLKEKDAEIAKARNEARHRQSVSDRQFNEQSKEIAELKGIVQGISQRKDDSSSFDQSSFDEELAKRIAEDVDGKGTLEIMREMMREVRDDVLRNVKGEFGNITGNMLELNPEYRENKQQVEAISSKFGIDKKTALSIVKEFGPRKTGQPDKIKAPGRMSDNTHTATGSKTKRKISELGASPIGDSVAQSVLKSLGVTEDEAEFILNREVEE